MTTPSTFHTIDLPAELVYLRVSSYLVTLFPITTFNIFTTHIMSLTHSDFTMVERLLYQMLAINDIFGGCLSAIVISLMDLTSLVSIHDVLCQCMISGVLMSFFFSAWLMLGLSLNKCIQIYRPLRFRQLLTNKLVGAYITGVATTSFVVASLFLPIRGLPFSADGAGVLCRSYIQDLTVTQMKFFALIISTLSLSAILIIVINLKLIALTFKLSHRVTPNLMEEGALPGRVGLRGIKTIVITSLTSFMASALPIFIVYIGPRLMKSQGVHFLTWFCRTLQLGTWWWKVFIFNATDVRFRKCSKRALRHLRERCIFFPKVR